MSGRALLALPLIALSAPAPVLAAETLEAPPNVRANARDGDPPGRVQSEATLGVHGETIVSVWNDAIGYFEDTSMCGVGVSLDGGRTFTDAGELPERPSMRVSGDPWMIVTPGGDFLVATVDTGNDDGIAIHRGRREGDAIVWTEISTYVRAGGEALDKPALAHDPESGALYLTYVNWSQNRGELARSDDLGATWHEPLVVFESSRATGYVPAADGRGGVYVAWVDRIGQPGSRIHVRRSAPGGVRWDTEPTRVTTLGPNAHEPPAGYDREVNATFPSLAVAHGLPVPRALLAWTDGAPGSFDVFVSSSDDRGLTWRPPARLRDAGAGGEAFWPSLATHTDGRVVAGWYDRRLAPARARSRSARSSRAPSAGVDRFPPADSSATGFYVAASPDGGRSFGPDHPMSDRHVPWAEVPADFTPNFGDYVDVALDASTIAAAWADARAGDPDVVVARRADRLALRVTIRTGDAEVVRDGRVWTLAGDALVTDGGAGEGAGDPGHALVHAPLALLAPGPGRPAVLPARGGRVTGDLRLSVGADEALCATLSLAASDQLSPPPTPGASLVVTRSGAQPGRPLTRWVTWLRIVPGARDTLHVTGHVTGEGRTHALSGHLLVASHEQRLIAPREIRQEAWVESGNLRTRSRVTGTGAAGAPILATATTGAGVAESAGEKSAGARTAIAPAARPVLRVSPNPVARGGRVRLDLPRATDAAVRVYDVHGRLVRTIAAPGAAAGNANGRARVLDVTDASGTPLAPGVYFLRLESAAYRVLADAKLVVSG